jgi:tetrahydrodipicolinate N-succinyltransferase
MYAIRFFITIKLGGNNMKKKKLLKSFLSFDNSKVSKRKHKPKTLDADERGLRTAEMSLWAIYTSLSSCVLFGFYPYERPIFPPKSLSNNKLENNKFDGL